jgi:L-alanine-DL-glutamate epimerase-like enolase superfamily enzyme
MKIESVQPLILHVPVTGSMIADSTHRITHWGVVAVRLRTASGLEGFGFTGTHAHLPSDRVIAQWIGQCYGPLLLGEDASDSQRLWYKLYHEPPLQWVGRAGISQLALAAVDIALWDLRAKAADVPLWKLLGGATCDRLEAYNTDGGWLSLSTGQVVNNCRRFVDEGYRGVKIKIGLPEPREDLERIAAVRRAIGPQIKLAVDGNGKWDLPTALLWARRLAEHDVFWFEEPLWYDDVAGHAALARASTTPIALGEQLYHKDAFCDFIRHGAVHYVQPDVTRLGGITEWLQVADLAHAHRLPVAAHVGDMGQVHVHAAYAHPSCRLLEYIPWIREIFEEPIRVVDGHYALPALSGAGTTLRRGVIDQYGKPLA